MLPQNTARTICISLCLSLSLSLSFPPVHTNYLSTALFLSFLLSPSYVAKLRLNDSANDAVLAPEAWKLQQNTVDDAEFTYTHSPSYQAEPGVTFTSRV